MSLVNDNNFNIQQPLVVLQAYPANTDYFKNYWDHVIKTSPQEVWYSKLQWTDSQSSVIYEQGNEERKNNVRSGKYIFIKESFDNADTGVSYSVLVYIDN